MSKSDLLKELRSLTQAGMKNCLDALKEANGDLQKAIDLIKVKGQNIVSERENKTPTEGLVLLRALDYAEPGKSAKAFLMLELNCETDFTAKSEDFKDFGSAVWSSIADCYKLNISVNDLTNAQAIRLQNEISFKTKEKCIFRRWWIEEAINNTCKLFGYVHHPNDKIGVVLTLKAPSLESAQTEAFNKIGNDLAMQVAAMNPLAVSPEEIPSEVLDRQKYIFETQLKESNKPPSQWARIIEGKLNKWYTEVCLAKQESVVVPKRSIEQLIKTEYANLLGGELEIINFIRCQVGEGLEKEKVDAFSLEV